VSPAGPENYCAATGSKALDRASIIMPALSGHYCWTHGGLKLGLIIRSCSTVWLLITFLVLLVEH
jgi:hypothetical protein